MRAVVGSGHPPRHPALPPASVETSVKIRPAMPTEVSSLAVPTEGTPCTTVGTKLLNMDLLVPTRHPVGLS